MTKSYKFALITTSIMIRSSSTSRNMRLKISTKICRLMNGILLSRGRNFKSRRNVRLCRLNVSAPVKRNKNFALRRR